MNQNFALRNLVGKKVIRNISEIEADYEILNYLGRGTYGKVFRIKHIRTSQERALKIIDKIQKSSSSMGSFQQIQILMTISHPNILQIYEYYENAEHYFIVTQFIQGTTLYFDKSRVKINEAISAKIIYEILQGLNYIHPLCYAHRDLKPANLIVQNIHDPKKLKIKIIDWGLATLIGDHDSKVAVGTYTTMAPQTFRGQYTTAVDMWSLGIITYNLLTGLQFFKSKQKSELKAEILRFTKFDSRASEIQYLSQEAKQFLSGLLDKDAKKRMNPEEALNSRWIKKYIQCEEQPVLLKQTLKHLAEFKVKSRFQMATVGFLNNYCSSLNQKQKLDKLFKHFDQDDNGLISLDELTKIYITSYGQLIGKEQVKEIFNKLDLDHNNYIEYKQFTAFGLQYFQKLSIINLQEAFYLFDKDHNGKISWKQIQQILGGTVKEEIFMNIIDQIDQNGDQEIDFDEFVKYMRRFSQKLHQNQQNNKNSPKQQRKILPENKNITTENSKKKRQTFANQKHNQSSKNSLKKKLIAKSNKVVCSRISNRSKKVRVTKSI